MDNRSSWRADRSLLALAGSAWALFLLPPQLVAWEGVNAPTWAHALSAGAAYDVVRRAGDVVGLEDDYLLFGAPVALSWLMVGWPLWPLVRRAGRWTGVVAGLTFLGAPVTVASYLAADAPQPWHRLWGAEIWVLLAICAAGLVAGATAAWRRRLPRWWSVLMGATALVLVGATILFGGYFPHGSLVGLGLEVAVLALLPARAEASPTP